MSQTFKSDLASWFELQIDAGVWDRLSQKVGNQALLFYIQTFALQGAWGLAKDQKNKDRIPGDAFYIARHSR